MDGSVLSTPTDRFFELRFESIGGLGAHIGGKILAKAAVLGMDLNGAHFSSYGSEKKGSPIKSFVRLGPSDKPIRTSAPVDAPDVIVVFHSALLKHPATFAGLRADGVLIYSGLPGEVPEGLAMLPKTARIIRIDAQTIAAEENSRPNTVLIGTLAEVVPLFDPEPLLKTLSDEFSQKHPEAVASNEAAFNRGKSEFEELTGLGRVEGDLPIIRADPYWGYDTAPLGGVILNAGSTAWNNLSTSRTGWIPVFDEEKCVHCGMCDMVCPDLCLVWEIEGDEPVPIGAKLTGVDYQYCKGCMRCIETCPTEAITREPELPGMAEKLGKSLFPELVD